MGYKTYNCPVAKVCGGCEWLNVPYPIQLKRKHEYVQELFEDRCIVEPVDGMEVPLHFRTKILTPCAQAKSGKILFGLFAKGTHRIIDSRDCLITDPVAQPIFDTIKTLMPRFKVQAYNEDRREGFLRHVQIRVSKATVEVMVTLVGASDRFPGSKAFIKALLTAHPEITTVILNTNERVTNVVLGEKEKTLYGKGFIEEEICGKRFRLSSRSFFQTNPIQTQKLYSYAIEAAGLTGEELVLDAYCGTGTIGIVASDKASMVIGVESNADAVRDAKSNARINGAENTKFICADATEYLSELAEEDAEIDVMLMDPPRTGSTPAFLKAIAKLSPKKIVYVSCNPETQIRDINILEDEGYSVKSVQPVDMFPHTKHVETVVLLTKVQK